MLALTLYLISLSQVAQSKESLIDLIKVAAKEHNLEWTLVAAVVEQESNYNPVAVRYEPGFYSAYVASKPLNGMAPVDGIALAYERSCRAISFGLMQLMGNTARELGLETPTVFSLLDPMTNLLYGCKLLRRLLNKTNNDVRAALLKYNGGGNRLYPEQVLKRKARYDTGS
jgi:soluble lytic murein transglycosylase-like protein